MVVTRNAGRSASKSSRQSSRRSSCPRRASRPSKHNEPSDFGEGDAESMDNTVSVSRSSHFNQHHSNPSTKTTSAVKGKHTRAEHSFKPLPAKKFKTFYQKDDQEPLLVTPNWLDPAITFEGWVTIFLYAAGLGSGNSLATGWLIHAATICRAFTEPALTALYRCPPIQHPSQAKRLVALLQRPPTETLFNYRNKVESLHICINIVPQTILHHLIHPLPRLKELIIYTLMDQPPYRALDTKVRWHYSQDIFCALEPIHGANGPDSWKPFSTKLKSWEWSGRFIGGCVPSIEAMASVHETESFSNLTKLGLTNFQVPSLRNLRYDAGIDYETEQQAYIEDGLMIEAIAHAISRLAQLDHLVVESSTVMNSRLLPLLPERLTHIELINCWEIKSEDLTSFLITHGRNLGTLSLLHNQSLDLEFLTTLSDSCPGLRELHINMSYYRHLHCVDDADPMYDQALLPGKISKWPSSLRVINIEHVRDWSVEAAEMFFRSLIDNSRNLPNLRHLTIKTTLDIPWKARATMRRLWRTTMEKVFLRTSTSPRPHASLRQPSPTDGLSRNQQKTHGKPSPPSRRSRRLAVRRNSDGSVSKQVISLRCRGKPSYREPDSNTDEGEDEDDISESSEDANEPHLHSRERHGEYSELFIQGLCDTVNLQLDNQKIRELQYGMEDFLDEGGTDHEWIQDGE